MISNRSEEIISVNFAIYIIDRLIVLNFYQIYEFRRRTNDGKMYQIDRLNDQMKFSTIVIANTYDQILLCSYSSFLSRTEFTFLFTEEILSYFFGIMQIVTVSQFLNYNDVIIMR